MKLSVDTVSKIANIVTTANSVGIGAVIIDKESIRGQSEDGTVLLIDKDNVPTLDFDAIGISRVKVFNARIGLMTKDGKELPGMEAKIKEKDSGEKTVLSLVMKDKRTNIDYKCADPAYIKAPKNLKSEYAYTFDVSEETVEFMSKSNSALSHQNIAFELFEKNVLFRLTDVEGDGLTHIVSESCTIADGHGDTFFFKFNKSLLSLLKLALKDSNNITINLTKRGILNLKINNMNIYMITDI